MTRKIFPLIIFLLCSFIINAQEQDGINFYDPETWLLGEFEYDDLLREPHNHWFDNQFDGYVFDSEVFLRLEKMNLDNIRIKIVLGTWCPDSRREVPRFLKIIESLGYSKEYITYIGVDIHKDGPVDDFESLNIERVPTFIIYRNKNELGRIVEYPETSLEKDMLDIIID